MLESGSLYDPIRCKPVSAKPEEKVRQALIGWLLDTIKVPKRLIAVEFSLSELDSNSRDRADVVVWRPAQIGGGLKPWLLAECKAPSIDLDEQTVDQVRRYLTRINTDYIVITNGIQTRYFGFEYSKYKELNTLPTFVLPQI